jgi:hypothetical protein
VRFEIEPFFKNLTSHIPDLTSENYRPPIQHRAFELLPPNPIDERTETFSAVGLGFVEINYYTHQSQNLVPVEISG